MIKIVYACNDGYFDGLYLSILSIVRRCKQPIAFYLLTADCKNINPKFVCLTKKHTAILSSLVKKYNKFNSFKAINVTNIYNKHLGSNKNVKSGYSPYTTFRLLLNYIPGLSTGKIIYLDVDTMANGDISELYNLDTKNNEFLVCHDALGKYWKHKDYFNAGVILFNMDEINRHNTLSKAITLLNRKRMPFVDQDALYKSCTKYDFFPDENRFNRQQAKVYENDVIKHFCQRVRKWPFLNNIKQWDIKHVHSVLKIHAFDEDFNIYQKEKTKFHCFKEKLGLFVVTHKKINVNKYPGRKIIYVGDNDFNVDNIKTFKDNIGKNISLKNPIYCELTALYWIWQNYKDAEYVGIEHYRRCFYKGLSIAPISYLYNKAKTVDFLHFQTYYHPFRSERNRLGACQGRTLFPVLRNAIKNAEPRYLNEFDKQMKSWHCAYCNIFICKKTLFDKYMKFMFNVLFEAEKHLNKISPNERPRSIGYMAERLFNTFIEYNKYTHKSTLVAFTNRWKRK